MLMSSLGLFAIELLSREHIHDIYLIYITGRKKSSDRIIEMLISELKS